MKGTQIDMKKKRFATIVAALLVISLASCSTPAGSLPSAPDGSHVPEKTQALYSNLTDDSSRREVVDALQAHGVSQEQTDTLLAWADDFNARVTTPTIARQTNGKTEIVRITQPVLKGEQVTKENAEVVEVGGYNLPANVAHSLDDVEGLYVTADLAAGDYILTSKVSSVPISSDVALNDIPSGKVAISLTVKTLASGLSDKLQPNDIVRIYHFLETAEEVPELRFVKVLSVTDSDGINVDNAKEPTEDEEPQQSATITVLASPEQARIITELENDGVAHVALISRNNDQLAEELLAEQDKTLQEIYFPETLTEEGAEADENADGENASPAEDNGAETVPEDGSQPAE